MSDAKLAVSIQEFIDAQLVSKRAAAREMTLRLALFGLLADLKLAKRNGSSTFRTHGYKVEATAKTNITIYEAGLEGVRAQLVEIYGDKLGNGYYDSAFPAKITYSATGHKKLPEESREAINDALIAKPATPTLKFTVEVDENED